MQFFKDRSTKDLKETKTFEDLRASNISEVVAAVNGARDCYEQRRSGSQARKCLVAVAERLVYYGNIMDVMVEHHPEYVSLAWGAMKLLFGVSLAYFKICGLL